MSQLALLLDAYAIVILVRAVLTWTPMDQDSSFNRTLRVITEPILAPLRQLAPPSALGGLDISPALAIVGLHFLKRWLLTL